MTRRTQEPDPADLPDLNSDDTIKHSRSGVRYKPIANAQGYALLNRKVDEYFERYENNLTISGLALWLGYDSPRHLSVELQKLSDVVAADPKDRWSAKLLSALERARTRIVVAYEQDLRTGKLSPQAGRYVLEYLGITPPVAKTQVEASSSLAANAAKASQASAMQRAKEAGKLAKRVVAGDKSSG